MTGPSWRSDPVKPADAPRSWLPDISDTRCASRSKPSHRQSGDRHRPGGKRRGGGARPCASPRLRGGIHQPTDGVSNVGRDARPVDVQAAAVVDVLQVSPGRRAVLAAAGDAEIRLGPVIDDESAAGQEVAHPGIAALLASASVAIPSTRRVQISRMNIPPLLNGRGGGPEEHV